MKVISVYYKESIQTSLLSIQIDKYKKRMKERKKESKRKYETKESHIMQNNCQNFILHHIICLSLVITFFYNCSVLKMIGIGPKISLEVKWFIVGVFEASEVRPFFNIDVREGEEQTICCCFQNRDIKRREWQNRCLPLNPSVLCYR